MLKSRLMKQFYCCGLPTITIDYSWPSMLSACNNPKTIIMLCKYKLEQVAIVINFILEKVSTS